jgi:hypothetical protein
VAGSLRTRFLSLVLLRKRPENPIFAASRYCANMTSNAKTGGQRWKRRDRRTKRQNGGSGKHTSPLYTRLRPSMGHDVQNISVMLSRLLRTQGVGKISEVLGPEQIATPEPCCVQWQAVMTHPVIGSTRIMKRFQFWQARRMHEPAHPRYPATLSACQSRVIKRPGRSYE